MTHLLLLKLLSNRSAGVSEIGHDYNVKVLLKYILIKGSLMNYSVVHVTFSCDYSKVTQGLHGKQLAFHYLLDLKDKMETRRT